MFGFIVVLALVIGGYYVFLEMLKRDFIFTEVRSGWQKIVLSQGRYKRKLDPGWRLIGMPGVHKLEKRKLTFYKTVILPDGNFKAEYHDDNNTYGYKTTPYPYALPFIDVEDSNNLNLSGIIRFRGIVRGYDLALYGDGDFYATASSKIFSVFQEKVMPEISYAKERASGGENVKDSEEKARQLISQFLWEALNKKTGDKPSILENLRDTVGFEILEIDIPALDPPEGWRERTLAPFEAKLEKEAAIHKAEASAAAFDDTNQALALWKTKHPNASPDEIKEKQKELRDRAVLKSSQYHQEDVRISGVEGASTVIVGGGGQGAGGTGILVGNQGGSQKGGNSGGKGQGGGKGGNSGGKPEKFTGDEQGEGESDSAYLERRKKEKGIQ